jgi:tetratricopeptide (TPR) repeat protein
MLWHTSGAQPWGYERVDERPDGAGARRNDGLEADATSEGGAPDEVVSGELLPHDDAAEIAAALIGLRPLPADLMGQRRDLAVELRKLFMVLEVSVRRYAALQHHSASSVSRYLSGFSVPPDHFVSTLMDDVGKKVGHPLSSGARSYVTALHREAQRQVNPRAAKVQDLEDQLVTAHHEAQVARTLADAVATQLDAERQRIAGLEEERRQLAEAVTSQQATSGAEMQMLRVEQHRVRSERDALRRRVADLEVALEAAEHRVAQAEQRCTELERQLLAADAAAAEESATAAEQDRLQQQSELDSLRAEVTRLREAAERAQAASAAADDGIGAVADQVPVGGADVAVTGSDAVAQHTVIRRDSPDSATSVTIVYAGFNRAWGVWVGERLEQRGFRVVYMLWNAPAAVPLVDLLRDLSLAEGRVLIIVSEWFFQLGLRTHEEWNAALREVVAPDPSRFAAVSVTKAPVPSAAAVLAAVDLTDTGEDEAERRLLARLVGLPGDSLPENSNREQRGARFPAAMPEVWGGVPRRNTRFTGRESLLNDAYSVLTTAEPGAGVLTLCGMPGVGKTQLAAEYVYRFGSEYDVVWWVDAESRVSYRRLLAELAPGLGLSVGAEYGERLRAVRASLRRGDPYARWLLVLDGADEPEQIWDLVPTGPGHVLITSRNPEWSEHNSELLEVTVYDRAESVAFVRRRAPRLTAQEADQLAEALEDLPLLLDQTAGWLNDSDLSVGAYLELLDSGVDEDVVKPSADFPHAFQTAWSILLNKLRETVPESLDLLRLCTFFAPGLIPVRLLTEMPRDDLPERLVGLFNDPLLWNRAINQLRQYSVVRLESPAAAAAKDGVFGEQLYLHRMVHQIVHKDIPEDDRREFADVVRRALAAAAPGLPTDTRLWPAYDEIVPHLTYADVLASADPAVQTLVLNCLQYMWLTGRYAAGVTLGERALEAWRPRLGDSHSLVWDLTFRYANLLRSSGEYQRTERIEQAAVQRLRQEHGEDDLRHLRAARGLTADLWGLGRYNEALYLSEHILQIHRGALGEQDARTLTALTNLAVSLRLLGRYEEAMRSDYQALEARRSLLGGRHPWTLSSSVSYAVDLRLLGRYKDAESLQTRHVREYRIVMGADNPHTLRAEHELALCQYRGGQREAGVLFSRVLASCERLLGDVAPQTLAAAVSQSCFARENGDIDQAREAAESIVARYEATLPEGHPFIAGACANHALCLSSLGERDQAHGLMEQAMRDMAAAVGTNHPYSLGCAINAAALRSLVGETEAAAGLSEDAVVRATGALGRSHPLTLSARVAHAADLRGLGHRGQAEKVEREALADLAVTLGYQHAHTVSARSRIRPLWDFEPHMP